MPNAPENEIGHDVFVNLAVTIGPKFYGEKRPGTNEEIAEVLRSHAAHLDGLLGANAAAAPRRLKKRATGCT